MNLEDHAGDIVRKAREAAGLTREAAATLAGVTPAALEAFEKSGSGQFNLAGLAPRIGLTAQKLEGILKGWSPAPVDLSLWRELRVISTTEEGNTVNCYLVWDEVTREAALFDTGWHADQILALCRENQLELKHLFITHTHRDHIAALQPIREAFPKIRLHSSSKNAPVDQRNRNNDFIHLGSLRITNRETPGHAEDGVTYIIGNFPEDAAGVAIVGDCIFAGSMGTGFQSTDVLKESVRSKILNLPPDTLLCPGHGPLTTVRQELANNPFF
ncbi:MAG TPA: MBL fold metallo-hydrolase [Methylomirabilota bacterium]|nr:MBL fold metallo-hydrolase [Methylomirabilota bacterium]